MEDTWPREDPNPGQNVAQRWTDGSPFTYAKWIDVNPSGDGTKLESRPINAWNDLSGAYKRPFVCKCRYMNLLRNNHYFQG